MSTPGERFAEAGNELVKGIMRIQYLIHRPVPVGDLSMDYMTGQCAAIATICEELIGPYKLIIADLSREDFSDEDRHGPLGQG